MKRGIATLILFSFIALAVNALAFAPGGGTAGVGATGSTGPTGATGPAGATGPTGPAATDIFTMNFSIDQTTALIGNEHMGTYKTPRAVTLTNVVFDEDNVTCASGATVTCYDCGTSAGACTSGQTATLITSPSITTGNSGLSVDGTVSVASVASGHYISCLVTAGTCATFLVSASIMAQ
jgi:hypothetical protein